MVPGAGIGRPEDDFIQDGLAGIGLLYIQVVVADKTEQDAIAIDAIVSHHLLDVNLACA